MSKLSEHYGWGIHVREELRQKIELLDAFETNETGAVDGRLKTQEPSSSCSSEAG